MPNDDPSLGEPLMSTEETAEIAGMIFPNAIGLAGAGVAPRGAALFSLGRGATGSAQFASEISLARHFAKHGAEFGSSSANAYRVQASRFLTGRPGAGVLQRVRATNGDIVRYQPRTNEFGVITRDGTIRTYFRPDDGLEYFLNGN